MTADEAADFISRRTPVTAEAGEVSEAEASDFAIVDPKGRRIAWGTRGQADAIDLSDAYPEILEPGYRVEWLCPILAARRVQPKHTANCCECGRIVDTREAKDGGDGFGSELDDGRWTCSGECWEKAVGIEQDAPSPDVAGLIEAAFDTAQAAREGIVGEPQSGQSIAVWFSCGAASAVAAKETIRRYGNLCTIHVVNNPVAEEDADNRRFLRDVEQWLGVEIEIAVNDAYPDASAMTVWDRRGGMSFPHGAPCTISLKKEARQQWEARNPVDWHVLGFGAEERGRYERFILTERANTLPILIDAGLTRQDCYEIIVAEGLEPPRVYAQGYPNANCIGCVKATSPTYWNHVRQQHPEVFEQRAEQSRRLGAKLVRVDNQRIFLDELSPLAVGKPLKSLKMPECGLFCEEPGAPTLKEPADAH